MDKEKICTYYLPAVLFFVLLLAQAETGFCAEEKTNAVNVVSTAGGVSPGLAAGEDPVVVDKIDRKIIEIVGKRKTDIFWKYTPEFIHPHFKNQWKGAPASVKQAELMVGVCEKWLSAWPDEVTKHIKGVYIFDWLEMYGVKGVCIEYDFNLYMSSNMGENELLPRFFHEATHALTRAMPLDARLWSESLPAGVKYTGDEATKDGPMQFGEEWYKNGFLLKYSQSCADEEIAIIAQYMFANPEELKRLIRKYPEIGKRAKLAMDYFKKVSDKFDFSAYDDIAL